MDLYYSPKGLAHAAVGLTAQYLNEIQRYYRALHIIIKTGQILNKMSVRIQAHCPWGILACTLHKSYYFQIFQSVNYTVTPPHAVEAI
jgi:hypothetical protein